MAINNFFRSFNGLFQQQIAGGMLDLQSESQQNPTGLVNGLAYGKQSLLINGFCLFRGMWRSQIGIVNNLSEYRPFEILGTRENVTKKDIVDNANNVFFNTNVVGEYTSPNDLVIIPNVRLNANLNNGTNNIPLYKIGTKNLYNGIVYDTALLNSGNTGYHFEKYISDLDHNHYRITFRNSVTNDRNTLVVTIDIFTVTETNDPNYFQVENGDTAFTGLILQNQPNIENNAEFNNAANKQEWVDENTFPLMYSIFQEQSLQTSERKTLNFNFGLDRFVVNN